MAGQQGDGYTKALMTVAHAHHEIHEGGHFFIRDVVDQAINTVFDLQITVPDTTKWIHMTLDVLAEDEVDFFIYEGVTINVAGSAVTAFNSNRNSAKTSGLTIKSQVNASIGDANADTTTASPAVEIEHQKSGANRNPSLSHRENEIILQQNQDYCFRCVFTKAAYIAFNLNWYEHTNKTKLLPLRVA